VPEINLMMMMMMMILVDITHRYQNV